MIHPILAYGHPILRQKSKRIEADFPGVGQLVDEMWETMRRANGCGLAASQIGLGKRLFIVDSRTTFDHLDEHDRGVYFDPGDKGIMETFINATIVERSEDIWEDEEGCLSIPGLARTVKRNRCIKIQYVNKDFEPRIAGFGAMTARMIQHEYDHTEGILFLDYLKPITRKFLESRLRKIKKGQVETKYPMKFI